jgi:hypothetical protein
MTNSCISKAASAISQCILALHPTIAEVEEAALWAAGDGDVLAKAGHQLTTNAAEVLNILTANEEEEPPPIR